MPTYTVRDPQTGKTIKLTGDSPPTEAELTDIFATLGGAQPAPAAPAAAPESSMLSQAAAAVADAGVGAFKGAMNTVGGLGEMVRKIPGVNALDRVMTPVKVNTTPTNTAQKVGFGAEQIGEFFVPVAGVAGKAKRAVDVAKSGVLTMAQTGSPAAALTSAGITAAAPGVIGAVSRASGALTRSANKSMAQALGATKEWAKADAAKLGPQMLKRGVSGSRAAMLSKAKAVSARVGAELDDAYKAATAAGETVPGDVIRGYLTVARESLQVPNAKGALTVIPGADRVVKQLSALDDFVASLGDEIPVDRAATVKRTWDQIVSKAGLFGPKATASATDSADAWAIREASNAFRGLLNKNPEIADLNAEAAFWTGLKKVLKETEKRTQAQSGGLVSNIAGVVGAATGFTQGGPFGAIGGGYMAQQLARVLQSPWFRTTAAGPTKQALAEALASGQTGKVMGVLSKVAQATPARVAAGAR